MQIFAETMTKKKQKNQAQASPNANTAVQQRATTSAPKESITRQSFFDTISTPMALGFLVAGFLCTVLYAYWDFFTFKSLIFYTDMASDSVTAY